MIKLSTLLAYVENSGEGDAVIVRMRAAYFEQGEDYYSESKEAFLKISEMNQIHALNAAENLLRNAATLMPDERRPFAAMAASQLYHALVMRAESAAEFGPRGGSAMVAGVQPSLKQVPISGGLLDRDGDTWLRTVGGWRIWARHEGCWATHATRWDAVRGYGPFTVISPEEIASM